MELAALSVSPTSVDTAVVAESSSSPGASPRRATQHEALDTAHAVKHSQLPPLEEKSTASVASQEERLHGATLASQRGEQSDLEEPAEAPP